MLIAEWGGESGGGGGVGGGGEPFTSSLGSTIQMILGILLIAIYIKQGRVKDKRFNPSYRPYFLR